MIVEQLLAVADLAMREAEKLYPTSSEEYEIVGKIIGDIADLQSRSENPLFKEEREE